MNTQKDKKTGENLYNTMLKTWSKNLRKGITSKKRSRKKKYNKIVAVDSDSPLQLNYTDYDEVSNHTSRMLQGSNPDNFYHNLMSGNDSDFAQDSFIDINNISLTNVSKEINDIQNNGRMNADNIDMNDDDIAFDSRIEKLMTTDLEDNKDLNNINTIPEPASESDFEGDQGYDDNDFETDGEAWVGQKMNLESQANLNDCESSFETAFQRYGDDNNDDGDAIDMIDNWPIKPKDITYDWLVTRNVEEIAKLMRRLGLKHYSDLILKRNINGHKLISCDEIDLAQIGISYRPHRMKLLKLLHDLRNINCYPDVMTCPLYLRSGERHRKNVYVDTTIEDAIKEENIRREKMEERIERFKRSKIAMLSAVKIQMAARVHNIRRKISRNKAETNAAFRIQCWIRCCLARDLVERMREEADFYFQGLSKRPVLKSRRTMNIGQFPNQPLKGPARRISGAPVKRRDNSLAPFLGRDEQFYRDLHKKQLAAASGVGNAFFRKLMKQLYLNTSSKISQDEIINSDISQLVNRSRREKERIREIRQLLLHSSAARIQAQVRRHLTKYKVLRFPHTDRYGIMKQFLFVVTPKHKEAVSTCQALWRNRLHRYQLRMLMQSIQLAKIRKKENEAATTIQSVCRSKRVRKILVAWNDATTAMQNFVRGYFGRKYAKTLRKKNHASKCLQRHFRGNLARKDIALKKAAVRTIHSGALKWKFNRKKKDLIELRSKQSSSAGHIQRVFRGTKRRKITKLLHLHRHHYYQIVKIQACIRRKLVLSKQDTILYGNRPDDDTRNDNTQEVEATFNDNIDENDDAVDALDGEEWDQEGSGGDHRLSNALKVFEEAKSTIGLDHVVNGHDDNALDDKEKYQDNNDNDDDEEDDSLDFLLDDLNERLQAQSHQYEEEYEEEEQVEEKEKESHKSEDDFINADMLNHSEEEREKELAVIVNVDVEIDNENDQNKDIHSLTKGSNKELDKVHDVEVANEDMDGEMEGQKDQGMDRDGHREESDDDSYAYNSDEDDGSQSYTYSQSQEFGSLSDSLPLSRSQNSVTPTQEPTGDEQGNEQIEEGDDQKESLTNLTQGSITEEDLRVVPPPSAVAVAEIEKEKEEHPVTTNVKNPTAAPVIGVSIEANTVAVVSTQPQLPLSLQDEVLGSIVELAVGMAVSKICELVIVDGVNGECGVEDSCNGDLVVSSAPRDILVPTFPSAPPTPIAAVPISRAPLASGVHVTPTHSSEASSKNLVDNLSFISIDTRSASRPNLIANNEISASIASSPLTRSNTPTRSESPSLGQERRGSRVTDSPAVTTGPLFRPGFPEKFQRRMKKSNSNGSDNVTATTAGDSVVDDLVINNVEMMHHKSTSSLGSISAIAPTTVQDQNGEMETFEKELEKNLQQNSDRNIAVIDTTSSSSVQTPSKHDMAEQEQKKEGKKAEDENKSRKGSVKGVTPFSPEGVSSDVSKPPPYTPWIEVNDGQAIFYFNRDTKECRIDPPVGADISSTQPPETKSDTGSANNATSNIAASLDKSESQSSAVSSPQQPFSALSIVSAASTPVGGTTIAPTSPAFSYSGQNDGAYHSEVADNVNKAVNLSRHNNNHGSSFINVSPVHPNHSKGLKRTASVRVAPAVNGSVWEVHIDIETSLPFYYNWETQESQWEKPKELQQYDKIANGGMNENENAMGSNTLATEAWSTLRERSHQASSISNECTHEWTAYWDPESQRHFYYNNKTTESQWGLPLEWKKIIMRRQSMTADQMKMARQRVQYAHGSEGDEAEGRSRLKVMRVTSFLHHRHGEWDAYVDENERMFYVNSRTNESTWEPPVDGAAIYSSNIYSSTNAAAHAAIGSTSDALVEEESNNDDDDSESVQDIHDTDDLF